jgi:heat shock protein HslJ
MGVDGCNHFNGPIRQVDSTMLVFGPIAGTRKMCVHMQVPDRFNQLLNQVRSYQLRELKLFLYDEQQNELMSFQKTD